MPDGENYFAGRIQEMDTWICNASGVAIFDFPDEGTVDDYHSSTYVYLRTQPRRLLGDEFESDEPTGAKSLPTSEEGSSVAISKVLRPTSTTSDREVCKVCGCSFTNGETCIRCEEYQQSLLADCAKAGETVKLESKEEGSENFVSLHDMRELRVAHFMDAIGRQTAQDSVAAWAVLHICEEGNSYTSSTVVSEPELSAQETATPSSVLHEEENSCSGRSGEQEDLGVMSAIIFRVFNHFANSLWQTTVY